MSIKNYNLKFGKNIEGVPLEIGVNNFLEGFISWNKEEAYLWNDPFEENNILIVIRDYSDSKNLPSSDKIEDKVKDLEIYAFDNLPDRLKDSSFVYAEGENLDLSKGLLSDKEIQYCIKEMTMPEFNDYRARIINKIEQRIDGVLKNKVRVEKPIEINIKGQGDFYFSMVFKNIDIAKTIIEEFIQNPSFKTIKKYRFFKILLKKINK